MEKFINLGYAYSSVNTVTRETCYMVDQELYRNILLAVAAKKQSERYLATAAEKLEQHIEQIGNSNGRIMKGESDMPLRMNESFDVLRDEHNTRRTKNGEFALSPKQRDSDSRGQNPEDFHF